jgi:hypothetical protein
VVFLTMAEDFSAVLGGECPLMVESGHSASTTVCEEAISTIPARAVIAPHS